MVFKNSEALAHSNEIDILSLFPTHIPLYPLSVCVCLSSNCKYLGKWCNNEQIISVFIFKSSCFAWYQSSAVASPPVSPVSLPLFPESLPTCPHERTPYSSKENTSCPSDCLPFGGRSFVNAIVLHSWRVILFTLTLFKKIHVLKSSLNPITRIVLVKIVISFNSKIERGFFSNYFHWTLRGIYLLNC